MFNMDERSLVLIFMFTYLHRRIRFGGLQNLNAFGRTLSKVDFLPIFFFILYYFLSTRFFNLYL